MSEDSLNLLHHQRNPDDGYLRITFSSKVVVRKSVLDYTWLSAVAEMGGYVGLLLGIALIDIIFILTDRVIPNVKAAIMRRLQ